MCVCVCVCVCMRACVRALKHVCVMIRACARERTSVCVREYVQWSNMLVNESEDTNDSTQHSEG